MRRLPRIMLTGALVLATSGSALAAGATTGGLFSLNASEGRLEPVPGRTGQFSLALKPGSPILRLQGAGGAVTEEPARRFVARWGARGFGVTPPRAALVLDRAPAAADVALLSLSSPRVTPDGLLRFRARTVSRTPATGPLAAFARRADTGVAGPFTSARLLVAQDPGQSAFLTILVNALPSNPIGRYPSLCLQGTIVAAQNTVTGPGELSSTRNCWGLRPQGANSLVGSIIRLGLSGVAGDSVQVNMDFMSGASLTLFASNADGIQGPSTTITADGSYSFPIPAG
jgi:hypothetical protein